MGRMSELHATTASDRADDAEREVRRLLNVVAALSDGRPDEEDAAWWAGQNEETNSGWVPSLGREEREV